MKKVFAGFSVVILLFIVVIAGIFFWWNENTKPVSPDKVLSDFVVTKGTNAEKVGQDLYTKGFIRSPLAFKLYVQLTDKTQKVQAGQFKLSPSYSMTQVVDALSKGPTELWVTIPEGLRREEVVEKVISALQMQGVQGDTFRDEFLTQTKDMEGMLFPDTYLFGRDVAASKVVSTLRNTFDKRIDSQMKADIAKSGYTEKQIATLASIIERESKNKTADERPTIAGIFYNRIRLGMPLQADATVQYAIANEKCKIGVCEDWWPTVLRDDYQLKHPYSTYTNTGLPPGPIANPGLTAIKSAIYPTDSDFLYYIHEEDGTPHYAETLAEHNENVRLYIGR
jgi:UPF0755 protein